MTREQTIEAIKVMQAFVDGKELEVLPPVRNGFWLKATTPSWDWLNCNYRIKPTPVLRPWTEDDVPLGAWVRMKGVNVTRNLITNVQHFDLGILFQDYEHSTDGGKTWLPCGVVEEAK